MTFTWSHTGADTTHFQLETATSQFNPSTTSTLPPVGRYQRFFTVDKSKRSLTLTASQLTEAGAPGGSGLHLLYRLYALNRSGDSETIRRFPTLQAVLPEPRVSADAGTDGLQIGALRIGSFNVRTSKADDDHTWLERRAGVAKLIAQHNPDVLALQELGPGRADGKSGVNQQLHGRDPADPEPAQLAGHHQGDPIQARSHDALLGFGDHSWHPGNADPLQLQDGDTAAELPG